MTNPPSLYLQRRSSPATAAGRRSRRVVVPLLLLAIAALLSSRTPVAEAIDEADAAAGGRGGSDDEDGVDNPCQLYLAKSTIPNAGLGMFAGIRLPADALIGRAGDAAFPTVDQDWHNSPASGVSVSKHEADYHWPLTNYDWNAPDLGLDKEAEDVSVTVTGFGAAPNCHFRLLNVVEHAATFDPVGLDRYTSPGAGAITPWFNRTSTAARDIEAGSELFVDYGPNWFLSREDFKLIPVSDSFERAQAFLKKYGKLLVGSDNPADLIEDKMSLSDEAQKDLWEVIKTFPYPTRERQALPDNHRDAVRAIHGDIQEIEKENSIRSLDYLEKHGKCLDNIVPQKSNIPHAGRGAFATRFIPKGGLVAPAPVVHIADKAAANMYNETIGKGNKLVRDEEAGVVTRQIIVNYMFGHPDSSVLLFPYSSNVAYINHHSTEYNAEVRWAKDADWIHHEDWLRKPVEFLEDKWTSGMMLEFIALRDIQPGEEVLINYGEDWQKAWDEHVKSWTPIPKESDYNNLTLYTDLATTHAGKDGYVRAETLNDVARILEPLRTVEEQAADPYPHSVRIVCKVNVNHDSAYLFEPETIPYFLREWEKSRDDPEDFEDDKHQHYCNITERYPAEEDALAEDGGYEEGGGLSRHGYSYTVELEVIKRIDDTSDPIHERHEITDVPWDAIEFVDVRYTSDVFLKKAFRHEMALPEGVFPRAWMNLLPKEEEEKEA